MKEMNPHAATMMVPSAVDLILFAGQSNMAGRGNASLATQCPPGAGYAFHYTAALAAGNARGGDCQLAQGDGARLFTPLQEPFGKGENTAVLNDYNAQGIERRRGSMVSAFVAAYYAAGGLPVVAVCGSRGGEPTDFFVQPAVREELCGRFTRAERCLQDAGVTVRRRLLLWCQGETDGDRRQSEKAFKQNMETLRSSFLSAGISDFFIIKTGHFNIYFRPGADGKPTAAALEQDAAYKSINRWQQEFADAHDDVHIAGDFYTDSFLQAMTDPFHYRQEAYNEMGFAAGKAVATLLAGRG